MPDLDDAAGDAGRAIRSRYDDLPGIVAIVRFEHHKLWGCAIHPDVNAGLRRHVACQVNSVARHKVITIAADSELRMSAPHSLGIPAINAVSNERALLNRLVFERGDHSGQTWLIHSNNVHSHRHAGPRG